MILVGYRIPEFPGPGATRKIREIAAGGNRGPIVAATANALAAQPDDCLAARMDDYLSKPSTLPQLAAMRKQAATVAVAQLRGQATASGR